MLLYVHVPFCRAKCAYCAFASQPLDASDIEPYLEGLAAEAAHFSRTLSRPAMDTVFIGGGTPSLLPDWALERLVSTLRRHFELPKGIEFTLEANPDSADLPKLGALRELGVNRLSLGVQSLNDRTLALLGRPHTAAQAVAAVSAARLAGFKNLSLDFIWGLPGLRPAAWLKQLNTVVEELKPEHLSCYNLTLEPGTPLAAAADAGSLPLPSDDEDARTFLYGSRFLSERGYLHYEISNFARMGFACRHNQGYWQGRDYLGLGPSAVSTIDYVRRENPKTLAAWHASIAAGRFETQVEALDLATRLREFVMLSLRTSRGLSLTAYRSLAGRPFTTGRAAMLKVLREHNLIRLTKDTLRLTADGMLVSNTIISRLLDADLPQD
jgi:oxygen-independent coproporphyrinogen-3 oxidase